MVLHSQHVTENRVRLERLLSCFVMWEFDASAAVEFGTIRSELSRLGRPIPQIDVQIAAIARANELILLTSDRHFDHVRGLRCEDWTIPANEA